MGKYLFRILPAVALVAYGAENPATFPSGDSILPVTGTLRSSIEFAGETLDGNFSALMPFRSSLGESGRLSGSVLFAEPYGEWIEQGGVQAGLGLGFRQLFSDQPLSALNSQSHAGFMDEGIYVGTNVFIDMADTRYDQRFWNLGVGAEIGTRYVELRGRYHLPLGDGEETTVRDVARYRFPSVGTLTIDRLFTFLTESLEGWDAEASVLVPGLDQWVDLRVIGGYASFQSQTFDAIDYDTWKAGIEFRPVPAVVLSGMWFENENIMGDNWLFGIGLELPFETADLGDGKGGFWGHIKDAFKPRRRHLAERLSESARRGSLPMQIGTGLKSVRTTVSFPGQKVGILADGTIVIGSDAVAGLSTSNTLTINDASLIMLGVNNAAYSSGLIIDSAVQVPSYLNLSGDTFSTSYYDAALGKVVVNLTSGAVLLYSNGYAVTGGTLALVGPHGERIYATAAFLASGAWGVIESSYVSQGYATPAPSNPVPLTSP